MPESWLEPKFLISHVGMLFTTVPSKVQDTGHNFSHLVSLVTRTIFITYAYTVSSFKVILIKTTPHDCLILAMNAGEQHGSNVPLNVEPLMNFKINSLNAFKLIIYWNIDIKNIQILFIKCNHINLNLVLWGMCIAIPHELWNVIAIMEWTGEGYNTFYVGITVRVSRI